MKLRIEVTSLVYVKMFIMRVLNNSFTNLGVDINNYYINIDYYTNQCIILQIGEFKLMFIEKGFNPLKLDLENLGQDYILMKVKNTQDFIYNDLFNNIFDKDNRTTKRGI